MAELHRERSFRNLLGNNSFQASRDLGTELNCISNNVEDRDGMDNRIRNAELGYGSRKTGANGATVTQRELFIWEEIELRRGRTRAAKKRIQ